MSPLLFKNNTENSKCPNTNRQMFYNQRRKEKLFSDSPSSPVVSWQITNSVQVHTATYCTRVCNNMFPPLDSAHHFCLSQKTEKCFPHISDLFSVNNIKRKNTCRVACLAVLPSEKIKTLIHNHE